MAEVTLEVPALLSDATDGATRLSLSADRLSTALVELRQRWPVLATHVLNDAGELRPHVLLLLNGQCTRWLTTPDADLSPGDRLTILQAVSGG